MRAALREHCNNMAGRLEFDMSIGAPSSHKSTISGTVATMRYHVSSDTLSRKVRCGKLTDHRPKRHAKNAPLVLDEDEVAARWPKK
jgi:hypothetical protein